MGKTLLGLLVIGLVILTIVMLILTLVCYFKLSEEETARIHNINGSTIKILQYKEGFSDTAIRYATYDIVGLCSFIALGLISIIAKEVD